MRKENVITVNIVYRKKQSSNQEDIDFSITNTQHLHVRTDYKIIFSDLDQKSKLACGFGTLLNEKTNNIICCIYSINTQSRQIRESKMELRVHRLRSYQTQPIT